MRTIMNTPEQRQIVWDRRLAQLDYDSQMESARNEGLAQGESLLATLIAKLFSQNRLEDAKRCTTDVEYREKLYEEFRLA